MFFIVKKMYIFGNLTPYFTREKIASSNAEKRKLKELSKAERKRL